MLTLEGLLAMFASDWKRMRGNNRELKRMKRCAKQTDCMVHRFFCMVRSASGLFAPEWTACLPQS